MGKEHIPAATESRAWKIQVKLVQTPDEFAMTMAVRAATFLAEEDNITYFDEFNGNDYFATHFLALVDGDPAGVIRIRWFNGFCMLERVGIRKRYRSYKVFAALARAAIEHARRKGYRVAAGRARGDTYKLWQRFWSHQSGPMIDMYRGKLIPMVVDIPEWPELKSMTVGPFGDPEFEELIVEVEGDWDFSRLPAVQREAAE
jgi:GNAT superfamily N-acetyltransferase